MGTVLVVDVGLVVVVAETALSVGFVLTGITAIRRMKTAGSAVLAVIAALGVLVALCVLLFVASSLVVGAPDGI